MINRILIRLKVVQMLYSYMLTRTEFKVEARPDNADISPDRRFAYQTYIDLLMLLLEITGNDTHSPGQPSAVVTDPRMAKSRLGAALAADSEVRRLIFQNASDIDALRPLAQHLHDKVAASTAFGDFARKRKTDMGLEVAMWSAVIPTTITKDQQLMRAMQALPGYTLKGLRMGEDMLLETLRSQYAGRAQYANAREDLEKSLDKAYELYMSIFALMVELTREQERRIDTAKEKHLATAEERNPNMRFVNNKFIEKLVECDVLTKFCDENKVSWEGDIVLVNSLLEAITGSELYREYMEAEDNDFAADCDFWRNALRTIVFTNDEFAETLENKSVFWNDDLQIMGTFALKTIKQAALHPDSPIEMLPKYKDEEDARFGDELFCDTVEHHEEYRAYIDRFINTGSWDPERMAFMDIIVMLTAISELINYPKIPLAVTMNEYIEIANDYSTGKSGQFVNGILFNVVGALRQEGRIIK